MYTALMQRINSGVELFYSDNIQERCPGGSYGGNPWNRFSSWLENDGYEILGHGSFAVVVRHRYFPRVAIKIGLRKEDSGATYAAWARHNAGKYKCIPEIKAMNRFQQAYIVVMPEYERYDIDDGDQGDVLERMNSTLHRGEFFDATGAPIVTDPDVHACLLAIYTFFNGVAAFDLHGDNVMIDPITGQLIITDPVSFQRGTMRELV